MDEETEEETLDKVEILVEDEDSQVQEGVPVVEEVLKVDLEDHLEEDLADEDHQTLAVKLKYEL